MESPIERGALLEVKTESTVRSSLGSVKAEINFDCPLQERSNNNRPSRKGDQIINFNAVALRPTDLWEWISGRDRPAPESNSRLSGLGRPISHQIIRCQLRSTP